MSLTSYGCHHISSQLSFQICRIQDSLRFAGLQLVVQLWNCTALSASPMSWPISPEGKKLSRTQHEFKVYSMCVPCNRMCSHVFTSYALVFKVQSMQAKKIRQLSEEVSMRLNQMFIKIQPSMCHWIVTAGTLRWWHLSKSTVISLRRSSLFTCLSWKHHI